MISRTVSQAAWTRLVVSRLRSDNTQSAPELRRDSTASIALPDLSLTGRAASDRLQDPPLHYQFYGGSGRPPSLAAMAGLESVFNKRVEDSGSDRSEPEHDLIVFNDEIPEEALVDLSTDTGDATHTPSMWEVLPSVSTWFDLPEDSAEGRSTLTLSRREEEPSTASRAQERHLQHDDSASELTFTPSREAETPADVASAETAEGIRATAQVVVNQTTETLVDRISYIRTQELDLD